MIRTITKAILPVLLVALGVGACDDGDPIGSGTATVSVALTDNPGDVDSVWVDVREIYLQGDDDDEGRQTLLDEEDAEDLGLIELTRLADATLDLVEDVEIESGTYGQLRFVLDGAVLETEDGDVYAFNAEHPHDDQVEPGTLVCPSCSETGIKVVLSQSVADMNGGTHLIVLDFDVAESFGRQAGMSGLWVMHPVVRAVEIGFAGDIEGTVDVERDEEDDPLVEIPQCPAGTDRGLEHFIPRATAQTLVNDDGDPIVSTTTVASDGTFTIGYLEPDTYDLGYAESVEFDGWALSFEATVDPASVDVTSDDSETVEYTITEATCDEVS